MQPTYLHLYATGELGKRVERAIEQLRCCELCPRRCRVNRLEDERGICTTGRYARIASYGPHFGEEQSLVGSHGSGTIFIASCNLRCCFCQNYEISHDQADSIPEVNSSGLAAIMLELQDRGCHNINFVTPSHVLPQIIEALQIAIEHGLCIPLVYNCSGYETPASLELLDGVIDIYLADFKFWQPSHAAAYLNAPDYPEVARQALKSMHHQVGDFVVTPNGCAVHGLMVRHLLMPGSLDDAAAIISFIAGEISTGVFLNIMDQYHPCGTWHNHAELRQSISPEAYRQALSYADQAGLHTRDRRDIRSLLHHLVNI